MLGNLNTFFFWHMTAYWTLSMFYYVCDWAVDKLGAIKAFKIQGDRLEREGGINWNKYHYAIRVVLMNQIFISPLAWYFFHPLRTYMGIIEDPTWFQYVYQLSLTFFLNEIIFFYSHLLLHTPWFYSHFHKVHHEWTMPVAVRAFYCHPVEYFMANMSSAFIPPFLLQMNDSQISLWFVLASLNIVKAHCGFQGWGAEEHDLHHSQFTINYGAWTFLDKLHGTYRPVIKSVENQTHDSRLRHRVRRNG
jgi:sterol desaturase/sphingolipid hydroxylase (fatty acid hydroxylase superfamily)